MRIIITLDEMLRKRNMRLTELAALIDMDYGRLSILKLGKVEAIKISTLEAICTALKCKPADLLKPVTDEEYEKIYSS